MARPFAKERYLSPDPRLRQLGARQRRDKVVPGKLVYHAPRHGIWITVQERRADYLLEFYRDCPCKG